jgi:hypothetical protein
MTGSNHDGIAKKLASIGARRLAQKRQKSRSVVLQKPSETTEFVIVRDNLIFVEGTKGFYSFNFEHTAEKVFLDVTYCSGDSRPVIFTIGDVVIGYDFCSAQTGGYGPAEFVNERYGPFTIAPNATTKLTVSTSGGYFPHLGEIRVVDAEGAGADVSDQSTPENHFTWIVPPSQPLHDELMRSLQDFCFVETTQEPNPDFSPDPTFYNAINADGLWILASKQVDERVLQRAADLMRNFIPIEIRRLFLQWRAPRNMPQGPFRLVILDHKTNQQAGDCPDFPNSWPGRNGTANPGCFTSADDFPLLSNNKSNDESQGSLTVHEMTHALDMVIRQQLDPYFMQEVDVCFQTARPVFQKAYAAANRHEYLAEICTLFVGCYPYNFLNGCYECSKAESGVCSFAPHQELPPGKGEVNFRLKSDLISNDPDGYSLLKGFLIELTDRDDDSFWWQLL